jgi:hypothetical protein
MWVSRPLMWGDVVFSSSDVGFSSSSVGFSSSSSDVMFLSTLVERFPEVSDDFVYGSITGFHAGI